MGFNPFRALHLLARIGRPILRILGVKKKSVVSDAIEIVEVVDSAASDESNPKR